MKGQKGPVKKTRVFLTGHTPKNSSHKLTLRFSTGGELVSFSEPQGDKNVASLSSTER